MERNAFDRNSSIFYFKTCFRKHAKSSDIQTYDVDITPFHTALVRGDEQFVISVLTGLDTETKTLLLNTCVNYTEEDLHNTDGREGSRNIFLDADVSTVADSLADDKKSCFHKCKKHQSQNNDMFTLPLALTAASKNKTLLQRLIYEGANVNSQDRQGNTILHSLVALSATDSDGADILFDALLSCLTTTDDRWTLFKIKNKSDLTPLDLAVKLGLPEIACKLINTEGAYKITTAQCGIYKHVLYDVSDYESPWSTRSLLHDLVLLSEKQLIRANECELFQKEPFKTWIQDTINSKKSALTAWFLTWCALSSCVFLDIYCRWASGTESVVLNGVLIGFALKILFEEAAILYFNRNAFLDTLSRFKAGKYPASIARLYTICQTLLAISILLTKTLGFVTSDCFALTTQIQRAAIINTNLSLLTLLYFVQTTFSDSMILLLLGRMVVDVFVYFCIFYVFYIGFAGMMFFSAVPPGLAAQVCAGLDQSSLSFNVTNVNGSFVLFSHIYDAFLQMSLVMSPPDVTFGFSSFPDLTKSVYILGVIIVGIVMTNLQIGLMAQRIQAISGHSRSLLMLEKLSAVVSLREKTGIYLRIPFCRRMWHKYLYRISCRKYFRFDKTLTKVFIEVVEDVTD